MREQHAFEANMEETPRRCLRGAYEIHKVHADVFQHGLMVRKLIEMAEI